MLSISVLDKILKFGYSISYVVNNNNFDNVDYNTYYYNTSKTVKCLSPPALIR